MNDSDTSIAQWFSILYAPFLGSQHDSPREQQPRQWREPMLTDRNPDGTINLLHCHRYGDVPDTTLFKNAGGTIDWESVPQPYPYYYRSGPAQPVSDGNVDEVTAAEIAAFVRDMRGSAS